MQCLKLKKGVNNPMARTKVVPEIQQMKTDITGLVEAKDMIYKKLESVKSDRTLFDNEGYLTKKARTDDKVKLLEELLEEIQVKIDLKLDKLFEICAEEKDLITS